MKKIVLFLLGVTFLTSCSSDMQESVTYDDTSIITNSVSQDQLMLKSTVDPVLKQLYIEMINSQSYIDYDNARVVFYEKLGDDVPDSERDADSKMLAWIQNNITQTGFLNYQEAVDKHEDVVALGIAAIEANLTFHEYLAGAAPGALIPILDELEPVPADCKDCIKAYNNCVNIANSEYGDGMQKASQSFKEGGGVFNYSNQRQYTLSTDKVYYDMIRAIKMCSIHFYACCDAA